MPFPRYTLLRRDVVFQGANRLETLQTRLETLASPPPAPRTREIYCCSPSVAVLPYDPREDLVALHEHFFPAPLASGNEPWSLAACTGPLAFPAETPETAARRLGHEHIGLVLTDLVLLMTLELAPENLAQPWSVFLGRTVLPPTTGPIHVLTAAEAFAELHAGRIKDAATALALQGLALHHADVRTRWLLSDVSTPLM